MRNLKAARCRVAPFVIGAPFPDRWLAAIVNVADRSRGIPMRRFVVAFAAAACLGGGSTHAAPDPTTVQFLYQTCKDETAANAPRFCLGYILGVGQLMAVNSRFGDNFALCATDSEGGVPTGRAMIQAFVAWAEKHPESWSQRNVMGVALALREAWPCPATTATNPEAARVSASE